MWVMTKRLKGREYLYLYKSKWVAGKPKNVFVRYLGPKAEVSDVDIQRAKQQEKQKEERRQSSTV